MKNLIKYIMKNKTIIILLIVDKILIWLFVLLVLWNVKEYEKNQIIQNKETKENCLEVLWEQLRVLQDWYTVFPEQILLWEDQKKLREQEQIQFCNDSIKNFQH